MIGARGYGGGGGGGLGSTEGREGKGGELHFNLHGSGTIVQDFLAIQC